MHDDVENLLPSVASVSCIFSAVLMLSHYESAFRNNAFTCCSQEGHTRAKKLIYLTHHQEHSQHSHSPTQHNQVTHPQPPPARQWILVALAVVAADVDAVAADVDVVAATLVARTEEEERTSRRTSGEAVTPRGPRDTPRRRPTAASIRCSLSWKTACAV